MRRQVQNVTATTVAALLMAAAMSGCGARSDQTVQARPTQDTPAPRMVIPVEAGLPFRGPISEFLETVSRIEARTRVEVVAEGMGRCISVHADIGDFVQQGQLLAQLDTTEMAAQLVQNEVQVRQQRADYERAKQGYEFGGMPRAELDAARFAYEQGLASLRVQRLQLDNLTITSPISGLVVMENISVGQFVNTGTPVFTIVDPATFQMVVEPPERELARLSTGQDAIVTVDAIPGRQFRAEVFRIDPSADPITGTIRVRLRFDDADREALREGLFGRVRLVMDTIPDALLVSRDVVLEENGRYYIFVIEEQSPEEYIEERMTESVAAASEDPEGVLEEAQEIPVELPDEPVTVAIRREVEIGLQDSHFVHVTSGLNDDDLIVTVGQGNLRSGSEVTITTADSALAENINITREEALRRAREARGGNSESTRRRLRDQL